MRIPYSALILFLAAISCCPTVRAEEPPGRSDRDPLVVARRIDEHIGQKLTAAKVQPADLATDAVFLRRASLDITGTIPTAAQARAFLESTDPDKRRKLIDQLLAEPTYGQHLARLWRDRLAHEDGAGGARRQALEAWLVEQFNQNVGWDRIVTALLVAEGTAPPTAFVHDHLDDGQPRLNKLTAATARLFLGMQLQCAECHDHPYADWKQSDFWGLAALFSRTLLVKGEKNQNEVAERPAGAPKTRFGPPPIKMQAGGGIVIPEDAGKGAGTTVPARFLGGEPLTLPAEGAVRPELAKWVTAPDNPYFAPATVNRLWAHFFARGFINPVDDLHEGNPPSHPELLKALAGELHASGFDLKHLIRCICNSEAYQRAAQGGKSEQAEEDHQLTLFGRQRPKVMSAEVLYDALFRAAGSGKVTKGSMTRAEFVRLFHTRDEDGDPAEFTAGIPQVLAMMNDAWFNTPPRTVSDLVRAKAGPEQALDDLHLAALGRLPSARERQLFADYLGKRGDLTRGLTGVWWVLLNRPEFVLIP